MARAYAHFVTDRYQDNEIMLSCVLDKKVSATITEKNVTRHLLEPTLQ